jgi:hypothetical protein
MNSKQIFASCFALLLGIMSAVASIPSAFQITPGEGAVVDQISKIEIYGKTVSDIYSYPSPEITINGEAVAVTSATSGSENDLLTYTLTEPITAAGTYQIVIAEESFYYGMYEIDNSEISWSVTVEQQSTPDPDPSTPEPYVNPSNITITPDQGTVALLEVFTINFSNLFMVDYNNNIAVTLKDYNTNEVVATAKLSDGPNLSDGLITLQSVVNTPGTYYLDVPEGAFYDYMTDDDCPATKWLYIVEGGEVEEVPDNVSSTPENGAVVESFDEITVTFDDYEVVYLRESPEVSVVDNEGETVATATLEHATASNAVYAKFSTPITDKGKYTFLIPKNVVILGEDGDGAKYNATVKVRFAVQPFEMPFVYEYSDVTISPEQGRYSSLSSFTITFLQVQCPDINYSKKVTLVDNATEEVVATASVSTGAVINQLVIDLPSTVTEAGEYTLVCPEGAFYNGGSWDEEDLPEYKFAYVVGGSTSTDEPQADLVYADPESGSMVGVLDTIVLTYPEYDAVYTHDASGIKVVNDLEETVTTGSMAYNNDLEGNQIQITFAEPVLESGHYTVVIPARALILGDMRDAVYSAPLTLEYTISTSGIDAVMQSSTRQLDGVYNLQGIRVADTPEALPAGLYIYGGRKLLIK